MTEIKSNVYNAGFDGAVHDARNELMGFGGIAVTSFIDVSGQAAGAQRAARAYQEFLNGLDRMQPPREVVPASELGGIQVNTGSFFGYTAITRSVQG